MLCANFMQFLGVNSKMRNSLGLLVNEETYSMLRPQTSCNLMQNAFKEPLQRTTGPNEACKYPEGANVPPKVDHVR